MEDFECQDSECFHCILKDGKPVKGFWIIIKIVSLEESFGSYMQAVGI